MSLEYPLTDSLPNTDNARDKLLAKIFSYRESSEKSQTASDEDFTLLYAYGKAFK